MPQLSATELRDFSDMVDQVTAAHQLVREAVRAHASGRPCWQLAAALAVEFATRAAVGAQFGAQHTLAAVGYFSIMQVIGGGSIDIQRNLVARALGLPRA